MTSKTLQKMSKVNSGITFAEEKFSDIIFEMLPLWDAYEAEVVIPKGEKLDVDWEKYLLLEHNGSLKIQTARVDSRLVGVCIAFLATSLRQKTVKIAYSDLLFVLPEYRKGTGVGKNLISNYETMVKNNGAAKIDVQVDSAPLAKLLKWLGYSSKDESLTKTLGD